MNERITASCSNAYLNPLPCASPGRAAQPRGALRLAHPWVTVQAVAGHEALLQSSCV